MEAEFEAGLGDIKRQKDQGVFTLAQCDHFLNSLTRFTVKHTIEDSRAFLHFLGDPDLGMRIIHVAGTNGKGSVCSYLSNILQKAGFHTGLFTSPHLVSVTERFQTDGEEVSEERFLAVFWKLLEEIEAFQKKNETEADYFPSYFEFLFFMAMLLYAADPVDFLILETGLGGRLDATNTVAHPLVCVITEIGLDHMQFLGDTYAAIAGEKAGIIKKGVPVVFFDKRKESSDVIIAAAKNAGSEYKCVSENEITEIRVSTDMVNKKHIDFSYNSGYYKYVDLCVRTPALYQVQNAALAVSTAEVLKRLGVPIDEEVIRKGLADTFWSCRMEEIRSGFYVDGAHNADGMEGFLSSVRHIDCTGHRMLIFGVVGDKQYPEMVRMILESCLFDQIAVTVLETGRSLSINELKQVFLDADADPCGLSQEQDRLNAVYNGHRTEISFFLSEKEARKSLCSKKGDADLMFAAGSLYLAGQIKAEEAEHNDSNC